MFCPKCGVQNSDSASFCGSCGSPLGAARESVQTQSAVPALGPPAVPNRLTAAIFATIFFWPLGIPAIVNASHANAEARAGHLAEAQRAVKCAKRWIVASFLAFGLSFLLVVGAGIGVPIYVEHVKVSRASDARAIIGAIWQASQVYYQDKGEWPATVEELEQERYLEMAKSAKLQWIFSIVGAPPVTIYAVSTEQMKGGAGHVVEYDIENGTWAGYGLTE
jgi:hypothetical protein